MRTLGLRGHWSWPSSAHRLRLLLLPALSVRGRLPTGRPPPAGGNGSTTQDRESISLPVALFPACGFSHKTHLSGARFRLDPYAREVEWARPGRRGRRRVDPRTPHPAGDQGRHKQMIDPVAEPGQAAEASLPLFDATNGMEPDDARCVGACSDVLRDEHEVVD